MSYVFWNFFISKKDYIRISLVIEVKYEFEPSGFEHNHLVLPITPVL